MVSFGFELHQGFPNSIPENIGVPRGSDSRSNRLGKSCLLQCGRETPYTATQGSEEACTAEPVTWDTHSPENLVNPSRACGGRGP